MFGWGRKNREGHQKRLEHRGKHVRISRTGGISARASKKTGPVTTSVNTKHGVRVSTRIFRGLRFAFQRGGTRMIGRWGSGPLAFNLSKSGASASLKTSRGRLNLTRPGRSSFNFAGVSVRGKKAAKMQLLILPFELFVMAISTAFALIRFAFKTAWLLIWLALVPILFIFDIIVGFSEGFAHDD